MTPRLDAKELPPLLLYHMSEHQPSASAMPPPDQSLHLLIVEDSPMDVELAVLTLKQAQFRFTYDVADTLPNCAKLLAEHGYDAVLSDYRLPGFTAYQILELLRQSGQDIPFILVTGMLGEEAAVDCIKAGMTDYVIKERLFRLPTVLERSLQEFELRHQKEAAVALIRQKAQREAIINRIVQALRGTLVLDEVMQTTADMLHDTLQVDRCIIFRPDPDHHLISRYVSQATVDRENLLGWRYSLPKQQLKPLNSSDPVLEYIDQNLPSDLGSIGHRLGARAILMAPLLYQQAYLGSICLHQCSRNRRWTEDEVTLIKAIADQCAIAIHQVQLFDRVQRQAQQEQLLNQISQAINSSLDPDHILQEIVQLTGEAFDVDRVIIYAVPAKEIRIEKEWLSNDAIPSMLNFVIPVSDWFDVIEVPTDSRSRYVLHAPDYATLPRTPARQQNIENQLVQSILSVPIFIHDHFFGGLELHATTQHRTFSQDEINQLERIADQTAIALYNAQSYERLEQLVQQRTQELEQEKLLSDAANRAKSEFLTHMSHELRTPLTGILGFSSLLHKQVFGALNAKQVQYVEGISSCGQHLLELINDLLDLSKIEAGKEELFLETVVVQEVCQACIAMIQELANKRGLTLSYSIEPEITVCIADKRRLKQILFNLLSNAVKFTSQGSVRLQVSEDNQMLHFAVVDTGIGISVEDQAKLFQAFQQLDGGLSRKYEGTGLGLALARKLAQLHDGDITVTSEPNQGSCFTLHFPISLEIP